MPIQIPRLNRLNTPEPTSVGRIEARAPDASQAFAKQSEALEGVLKAGVNYFQAEEDRHIDTESLAANNDFESQYKAGLQKAKLNESNPVEAFGQFDDEMSMLEMEIDDKYADASPRLRDAIKKRVQGTKARLYDDRMTSEAIRVKDYEKKNTQAGIELTKGTALSSIATVNVKNPDSFNSFDSNLGYIEDLIVKQGRKDGLVYESEEGELRYQPQLIYQIRKEKTEALRDAIDTLNASGKPEEAKYLMDRYGDEMLQSARSTLTQRGAEAKLKKDSLMIAEDYYGMESAAEAFEALNNRKDLNPETKQKVRGFVDEFYRQRDNANTRTQKQTYQNLWGHLQGKGYDSIVQLENDPVYARLRDDISPSQDRAIRASIKPPKTSNDENVRELYDTYISGGLKGMQYGDLQTKLEGLNQSDRNKFSGYWEKENKQTPGQEGAMVRYMGKRLREQLLVKGKIKKQFNGKFSAKDDKLIIGAYNEMISTIDSFPPGVSVVEQDKWVTKFVDSYIQGEVFKGTAKPQRLQSAPSSKSLDVTAPKGRVEIPEDEEEAWLMKFEEVNGHPYNPDSGDNLEQFYKQQGGKL